MPVQDAKPVAVIATDGTETEFVAPFRVNAAADLEVQYMDSDGTLTPQKLTTDYTVDLGAEETTVTFVSAPADEGKVILRRVTPLTQEADLASQGPLNAEVIEGALDKLTMISQELREEADRVVKEPIAGTEGGTPGTGELYVIASATEPVSPADGQIWCDTATQKMFAYNASTAQFHLIGDMTQEYLGLLPRSAGASYPLTGDLNADGNRIINVGTPVADTDAITKAYAASNFLPLTGGKMAGNINMDSSRKVVNLAEPTYASDAATKGYIDAKFHATTGHKHTGEAGDGPKLTLSAIDTTDIPVGSAIVGSSSQFMAHPLFYAKVGGLKALTVGSWVDIVSITASNPFTWSAATIWFTAHMESAGAVDIALRRVDQGGPTTVVTTVGWLSDDYAPYGTNVVWVTTIAAPDLKTEEYEYVVSMKLAAEYATVAYSSMMFFIHKA